MLSFLAAHKGTAVEVRLSCHDLQAILGGQGACRNLYSRGNRRRSSRFSPANPPGKCTGFPLGRSLCCTSQRCGMIPVLSLKVSSLQLCAAHTATAPPCFSSSTTQITAQNNLESLSPLRNYSSWCAANRSAIAQPRSVFSQVYLLPQFILSSTVRIMPQFSHANSPSLARTHISAPPLLEQHVRRSSRDHPTANSGVKGLFTPEPPTQDYELPQGLDRYVHLQCSATCCRPCLHGPGTHLHAQLAAAGAIPEDSSS
jgi:hypothetical protein